MIASLTTPWGRFSLPLPGGASVRFFLRCAGPGAAEAPAPEIIPSMPVSGAGCFTPEGDLIAVPPFERAGANRFSHCVGGAAEARRSHKQEVASSNLAPATSRTPESDRGCGGGNPAAPAGGCGPP